MVDRWTEWKSFPDPFYGQYIAAPIGPGVYEVCDASTREQIAFGCTYNVAESLTAVLKPSRSRKRSFFRPWRSHELSSQLEYRTWPTGSLNDAKVVVDQILSQREAVWRRFSTAMRA